MIEFTKHDASWDGMADRRKRATELLKYHEERIAQIARERAMIRRKLLACIY